MVSELDEGIIVVARNGEVLSANPAAARMLAVDLERLRNERIEKRPHLLYHEDGQALATVDYPLRQALHTARPVRARFTGWNGRTAVRWGQRQRPSIVRRRR